MTINTMRTDREDRIRQIGSWIGSAQIESWIAKELRRSIG
jgi:hypothetical protein